MMAPGTSGRNDGAEKAFPRAAGRDPEGNLEETRRRRLAFRDRPATGGEVRGEHGHHSLVPEDPETIGTRWAGAAPVAPVPWPGWIPPAAGYREARQRRRTRPRARREETLSRAAGEAGGERAAPAHRGGDPEIPGNPPGQCPETGRKASPADRQLIRSRARRDRNAFSGSGSTQYPRAARRTLMRRSKRSRSAAARQAARTRMKTQPHAARVRAAERSEE